MLSNLKVCIAFCAVCLVVASVAIVIVLTRQTQSIKTDSDQPISESIIKNVQLPKGSYTVDRSKLNEASNKWVPSEANNSVLQSLGIVADPTNDVLVSDRKTYLFVILPSLGPTASQKQDNNSITGIGIQFGSSTYLHVVPISLTSTGQGFLKRGTLKDGSELYQIPIVAPNSMCSSAPGSHCVEIEWKPYSVGDQSASPASRSSSLSAACGSQCSDSQAASCGQSCNKCGSGQVQGSNTPRTARFNLGRKVGTFELTYQTYTVPDRIAVFQDEKQIFDTGCVGTGDIISKFIKFSGNSEEIRIDVEPNCDGTTSTQWFFEVICPIA